MNITKKDMIVKYNMMSEDFTRKDPCRHQFVVKDTYSYICFKCGETTPRTQTPMTPTFKRTYEN